MNHTSIAQRLTWTPSKGFHAFPRRAAPSGARRISTRLEHRTGRPFTAILFAVLLLGPSAVQAAECPASSPEDPQERRKLAKEWFGLAEAAESAANDAEATRAYACSYKMVAHPFTAFNLGRVAERSGNNELALKMFKAYLTLKPDAADTDDVKVRIRGIEEKIAAAESGSSNEGGAEATPDKPAEPEPEVLTPPPPPPPPAVTKRPEPEPERPISRTPEWVVGGVAAATLVTGIILNVEARNKMSNCQTDATRTDANGNPNRLGAANSECEAARPLAYWSYAMFSLTAAAAVTDALLLLLRNHGGGSSSGSGDEASVGFAPLPGGGALTARGRF